MMGVAPYRQFARVLADVARFAPDLVLITGDVTNDGDAQSYRSVRAALSGIACPLRLIPGNHDDPATLAAEFGSQPIVMRAGGWRLVLLNTHVAGRDGGRLRSEELQAAAAVLADDAHAPVLVALHHPPVSLSSPWLDAMGFEGAEWLANWIAARPAVRLVLAGHVHQAAYRRFAGARLYTAPSTYAQFVPRTERPRIEDHRPAWRLLRLDGDGGVHTRVRRLRGTA